jgi:hypothetical protein
VRQYYVLVSLNNGKVLEYTKSFTLIRAIKIANYRYRYFKGYRRVEVYRSGMGLIYTAHGFTD